MGFKLISACILVAIEAYLLGSIVFGILISKHFCHDDVRTHGSGSAGMTNMLRNYGKAAGAATAVGDVAKGAVAVILGRLIFEWMLPGTGIEPICGAYLAGIFAVIGHTLPIYFGFKGGKGVLVGAGAILATSPIIVVALLVIFLIEFAITRIVSLGSIIVAGLYPVLAILYWWLWEDANLPSLVFIGVCAAIMGGMVIYMHRTNIQRLHDGTEYRFTKKK